MPILDRLNQAVKHGFDRFVDALESTGIAGEAAEPLPRSRDQIIADKLAAEYHAKRAIPVKFGDH